MRRLTAVATLCIATLGVASLAVQPTAGQAPASATASEIAFDSVPDFLHLPPGMNLGEVPGVAVDSKHHIYVFSRSGATG